MSSCCMSHVNSGTNKAFQYQFSVVIGQSEKLHTRGNWVPRNACACKFPAAGGRTAVLSAPCVTGGQVQLRGSGSDREASEKCTQEHARRPLLVHTQAHYLPPRTSRAISAVPSSHAQCCLSAASPRDIYSTAHSVYQRIVKSSPTDRLTSYICHFNAYTT